MDKSRPDIAYAICILSRFTSKSSIAHREVIGRTFGYLKETKELSLVYNDYPGVLDGYSDASYLTHNHESKASSGWVFILGGGAVSGLQKSKLSLHT